MAGHESQQMLGFGLPGFRILVTQEAAHIVGDERIGHGVFETEGWRFDPFRRASFIASFFS